MKNPATASPKLLLVGDIETNSDLSTCPLCNKRIVAFSCSVPSATHAVDGATEDYTQQWKCALCDNTNNTQANKNNPALHISFPTLLSPHSPPPSQTPTHRPQTPSPNRNTMQTTQNANTPQNTRCNIDIF